MEIVFYIVLVLAAFVFMEFWAWFSHKYIMHGFLWVLHKDHHFKGHSHKSKQSVFEKNDFFFVIFALPAIILIFTGIFGGMPSLVFIGVGITLYGAVYFLIHDVVIHRRMRFSYLQKSKNKYLKAILRAHAGHHIEKGDNNYVSYGLLIFPKKFLTK